MAKVTDARITDDEYAVLIELVNKRKLELLKEAHERNDELLSAAAKGYKVLADKLALYRYAN